MATLAKTPYPLAPIDYKVDFKAGFAAHEAGMAALQARSDALPEGEIVGAIVRFPMADGYAVYLVTKDRPLTLQHVPFSDAWQVPYAHIRGLRRDDIVRQLQGRKAMARAFARK